MESGDVIGYLDQHQLEAEITAAVSEAVEAGTSQPLAFLSEFFAKRAASAAVDFDYKALCADIRELVRTKKCGPLLVRLALNDAATFSTALGGGGPNAAMRFADGYGGEAAFEANAGLDVPIALLAPLKAKYPKVGHADLWCLAANVAIEAMGGPAIATRFGRVDASSAADGVDAPAGRLQGADDGAEELRELWYAKGFNDREIVALQGANTVGGCLQCGAFHSPAASEFEGHWTDKPHAFDGAYFADLLERTWVPHASSSGGGGGGGGGGGAEGGADMFKDAGSSNLALISDLALVEDADLRPWVEAYAADAPKFFSDFCGAWWKLQELGCAPGSLAPHPQSLEYVSPGCHLPANGWVELPLLARREHNHDATIYAFGLPTGVCLGLPPCACVLLRAPGRGRGAGGHDDWDGSDAVRPYAPISEDGVAGRFELLVKRHDDGDADLWLHTLPLGAKVGFKHTKATLRAPPGGVGGGDGASPFGGKRSVSLVCTGGGVAACYRALQQILGGGGGGGAGGAGGGAAGEAPPQVVLVCGNTSPDDILLRDELSAMVVRANQGQGAADTGKGAGAPLKLVHVVGAHADELPPPGWKSTPEFRAESGVLDAETLRAHLFAPADDTLVLVATDRPAELVALCGPRAEREVRPGSYLHELGYSDAMVVKL